MCFERILYTNAVKTGVCQITTFPIRFNTVKMFSMHCDSAWFVQVKVHIIHSFYKTTVVFCLLGFIRSINTLFSLTEPHWFCVCYWIEVWSSQFCSKRSTFCSCNHAVVMSGLLLMSHHFLKIYFFFVLTLQSFHIKSMEAENSSDLGEFLGVLLDGSQIFPSSMFSGNTQILVFVMRFRVFYNVRKK